MAGVNKTIIIGNLGRDPELRYLPDGTAVCKLAVATSEKWIDKKSNNPVEKTEWHRIAIFGKPAENAHIYLKKGSKVFVEGKLRTSTYDKEGQRHYSTEIVAKEVQYLDKASGNTATTTTPNKPQEAPSDQIPDHIDEDGFESKGHDDDIPF